jgi:hypothetical protein
MVKEKTKVYSDFQMKLMESTSKVDELVASIDDTNIDVLNEINDCKEELERLEQQKSKNNMKPG